MRRVIQSIAWSLLSLAVLLVVLTGALLLAANTGPGRQAIEALAPRLSGGMVRISGLTGRFPDAIHLARIEITDRAGSWLTLTDADLEWSPRRLIHGEVAVDRLAVGQAILDRLPERDNGDTGNGLPPLRLTLRDLHVARLEIGASLDGQPIVLGVEGSGELRAGSAHLAATAREPDRGEAAGHYSIDAKVDSGAVKVSARAAEGPDGLIARLAGLPLLGAIRITAALDGPERAIMTSVTAEAGPLHADINGRIDAVAGTVDLALSANAPAMTPKPGLSWSSVRLNGQVTGPARAPRGSGNLIVVDLATAGLRADRLTADLSGAAAGVTQLVSRLDGLRMPGTDPMLFASAPLILEASARMDQPGVPLRFTLRHPLLSAEGTGEAGAAPHLRARVTAADLAPLAAAGGIDLRGRAGFDVDMSQSADTLRVAAHGTVAITGGQAPAPALIGDTGMVDLLVAVRGDQVTLTQLSSSGKAFDASAHGTLSGGNLDLDWLLHLTALAAIQPALSGSAEAHGHAGGPLDVIAVKGDLAADIAAPGFQSGHLTAGLAVDGLPAVTAASVHAEGSLLDAPLLLDLTGQRHDGGFAVTIDRGTWKSLNAAGSLRMAPGTGLPAGGIQVTMTRLQDLAPLLGRPASGRIAASVEATDRSARIDAALNEIVIPGAGALAGGQLMAEMQDLAGEPRIDTVATLEGLAVGDVRGSARVTGKGPLDAVAMTLNTGSMTIMSAPARFEASGTVNAEGRSLALASMLGTWKGQTIRLLAPARIGFADGVSADRVRLGMGRGELEVSGRAASTLDISVRLTNLPADLAGLITPDVSPDGVISGEAHLTGPALRPDGTISMNATGIRMRSGPGLGLPAANVTARAVLNSGRARIDGRLSAASSLVTLSGSAAISGSAPLDLRVGGSIDLAAVSPLLAAEGRHVRGQLTLDTGVGGTAFAPRLSGTARLTHGDFQDFRLGIHLSDIDATFRGEDNRVRLASFRGKAGAGAVSASGSLALTGARHLDLALRADNARLLSSDLITSVASARLNVAGILGERLTVSGTVSAQRTDIQVPERLPSSVAVLDVRDAGKPWTPPPPPPPPMDVALDVTLDAPSAIYVRGRGLDVELGGKVLFKGTAAQPVPEGRLQLRRGTVSLAGQSLTLTEGTIDFTNGGLTNPSLELVATSASSALTAKLTVGGSIEDPKITLSSVPELPQDEILAQLLFNNPKSRLSPFQVAQIAGALASLAGVGPQLGDPLAKIRAALGLDQLTVGTAAGGAGGPALIAGRYLAPGVRVGVQQNAAGTGTTATVQIDIARGLKLETTAGTGSPSATGAAAGADAASVGITYQVEY